MQAFLVRGTFKMARNWTPFAKEVAADTQEAAVERVFSEFGSKHGVPRSFVKIKDVAAVPLEQVQDAVVRYRLEGPP